MSYRLLTPEDLADFGAKESLPSQVRALLKQQLTVWPACSRGFAALYDIYRKRLKAGGDRFVVQHNPLRIKSVAANVQAEAIKRRECFLCAANLPAEQDGLAWGEWVLLCNPRPIFARHFTIVHRQHRAQRGERFMGDLLELAKQLEGEFAVFYNGGLAGASAPDHLHFQACPAKALPLFAVTEDAERLHVLVKHRLLTLSLLYFGGVEYLFASSSDHEVLGRLMRDFIVAAGYSHTQGRDLVNILVRYVEGRWEAVLIPREKHRPRCYFERGEARLLISPGCVELAGVVVIPRRDDFEKVDGRRVREILREVVLNERSFTSLIGSLEGASWLKRGA
jgi:hypothetical protein